MVQTLIKFIINKTIRDKNNVSNTRVRESYGVLSGVLGVICNLLLFAGKLTAGLLFRSIAVISDAFNNLSDLGSSIITIFGAKLSNAPADKEHPQGHGRFEYVSALIVAFIIFGVGLQLITNSAERILNPEEVKFSVVTIIVLIISILVKLWMFSYNKYIGRLINSAVNLANARDSINDVIATSVVTAATIISAYISFPLDGVVGLAISLLIMYTGFKIAKDSVNLLLGMIDPVMMKKIYSKVLDNDGVKGVHDLVIHDYGPGRTCASIHVEIEGNNNVVNAHEDIDKIEQQIKSELGINLVIHIDPIIKNI
ncbi:MAG: cation diffusion facilitator family transporter [Eubacteriales bacterium]|nr:cation diffusion facilitator family transporter [Eubacteriales bacterium]